MGALCSTLRLLLLLQRLSQLIVTRVEVFGLLGSACVPYTADLSPPGFGSS